MKSILRKHYEKIGRLGGKKTALRGRDYYVAIGKKGNEKKKLIKQNYDNKGTDSGDLQQS